MSLVGFDVAQIDFFVLDNNNPKTLVIFDQSHYLEIPEKPLISVVLPGYSIPISLKFEIEKVNVLNSDLLGLTDIVCNDKLADLPDGIYEITLRICPYDQLFKTQLYLKTTQFECRYKKLLLGLDISCNCLAEDKIAAQLLQIEILIQSAKAEVEIGNREKGQEKYNCAVEKLTNLENFLTK